MLSLVSVTTGEDAAEIWQQAARWVGDWCHSHKQRNLYAVSSLVCGIWPGMQYPTLHAVSNHVCSIWPCVQYPTSCAVSNLACSIWPCMQYLTLHAVSNLACSIWPCMQYLTLRAVSDLACSIWPCMQYWTNYIANHLSVETTLQAPMVTNVASEISSCKLHNLIVYTDGSLTKHQWDGASLSSTVQSPFTKVVQPVLLHPPVSNRTKPSVPVEDDKQRCWLVLERPHTNNNKSLSCLQ